jgi:hypothetical protein
MTVGTNFDRSLRRKLRQFWAAKKEPTTSVVVNVLVLFRFQSQYVL